MFGGWFRSLFKEWLRSSWLSRSYVDSLISSLNPGYEASPGEEKTACHLLRRLIRKFQVIVVGKALPAHDMPMARYQTSRLRRWPALNHNS